MIHKTDHSTCLIYNKVKRSGLGYALWLDASDTAIGSHCPTP